MPLFRLPQKKRGTPARDDVRPELEAICSRALAMKRYARYESAADLAEDVQRWMAGEPVSAYEEPWSRRAQRWVLTHRRLSQFIAALATVLLVAAVTMGVVSQQNRIEIATGICADPPVH